MQRVKFRTLIAIVIAVAFLGTGYAQHTSAPIFVRALQSTPPSNVSASLAPLKDPATVAQIREYLRLSGELASYRLRWIAAVDKNRSIGAPYWPESFWTTVKDEMQKTDLMPMFITVYQHDISKELMQEILDAYHALGTEHFKGSPACFKLGNATPTMSADIDKMTLINTQNVLTKVYAAYKPQIKEARAQYLANHPDWKDGYQK